MKFETWLDTLIEEKKIDLDDTFEIKTENTLNIFTYGAIINGLKNTTKEEQKIAKSFMVLIDFRGGDVRHYLRHIAQAWAV